MSVGQLLQVICDVIVLLESQGILLPDGSFDQSKLDTVSENVAFAVAVKDVLKRHGLEVPENVEKIIQLVVVVSQFVR